MNTNVITVHPLTRIEGHARITIFLDQRGNVRDSQLQISSLRGFEHFIRGRPAEEVIRLVPRICGICPWMHHLAAVQAVEACFAIRPGPAAVRWRDLCLHLAHIGDKILHFYFLAAPDFLDDGQPTASGRSFFALLQRYPEMARQALDMRRLAQDMLSQVGGRAIHPVAAVVGGFATPLEAPDQKTLRRQATTLLDFACATLEFARQELFPGLDTLRVNERPLATGFLGMVDRQGALTLSRGHLRLMRPDGSWLDFAPPTYDQHLQEESRSWSNGRFPWAAAWNEGFSLDPARPRGVYRVGPLARLNVADTVATPRAREYFDAFRHRWGRPVQDELLGHWARLIEFIYVGERLVELLEEPLPPVDTGGQEYQATAGRGVGCLEAPRGTLIHDYTTDDNGCLRRANMVVATTHNNGAMNLSVRRTASQLIRGGACDPVLLNRIAAVIRAYDP